jgi:glycosyltransferase involved in cell wall biosynthesis
MNTPLVSVIMPVHNAAPFVGAAIRSVLAQTHRDFELLVVDDASSDGSAKIIAAIDDPRIRFRRSPVPLNAAGARNLALSDARGEFVAFLDADDLAEPERFRLQIAALHARPNTGVVASLITSIDESGRSRGLGFVRHREPEEIGAVLLFQNCLALSSVMARRAILKPFVCELAPAEDYDLWVRLAAETEFCILPDPLTQYRTHPGSVSVREAESMVAAVAAIHRAQLARFEMEMSPIHALLSQWPLDAGRDQLAAAESWLGRLVEANDRLAIYPRQVFRAVVTRRWFEICLDSWQLGWPVWCVFGNSPLASATLAQRLLLFRRLFPRVFRR